MIRFQALGVRFTIPLLTLLFPILAIRLGMRTHTWALLAALSIHEFAHLAAAKVAHVHISEIRLMPFGGSARIENPYALPAGKIIPTAAAGPVANLVFAVLAAAFSHWGVLNPALAAMLAEPNLVLFLFNLLPALPLDGGRIAFALLRSALGEARAIAAGIWSGRILAALLAALAAYSGLKNGKWNLTLILAAVFIVASEQDERSALSKSRIQMLHALSSAPSSSGPAQLYQADASLAACKALEMIRSRQNAWFIVLQNGAPLGLLDGHSLILQLLKSDAPDVLLGDMRLYALSPSENSGAAKVSVPIRFSG